MRNGVFARGGGFKHVNVRLVAAAASPGQVFWVAIVFVLPIPGEGMVLGRGLRWKGNPFGWLPHGRSCYFIRTGGLPSPALSYGMNYDEMSLVIA